MPAPSQRQRSPSKAPAAAAPGLDAQPDRTQMFTEVSKAITSRRGTLSLFLAGRRPEEQQALGGRARFPCQVRELRLAVGGWEHPLLSAAVAKPAVLKGGLATMK